MSLSINIVSVLARRIYFDWFWLLKLCIVPLENLSLPFILTPFFNSADWHVIITSEWTNLSWLRLGIPRRCTAGRCCSAWMETFQNVTTLATPQSVISQQVLSVRCRRENTCCDITHLCFTEGFDTWRCSNHIWRNHYFYLVGFYLLSFVSKWKQKQCLSLSMSNLFPTKYQTHHWAWSQALVCNTIFVPL